jgi:hypothetical protein
VSLASLLFLHTAGTGLILLQLASLDKLATGQHFAFVAVCPACSTIIC